VLARGRFAVVKRPIALLPLVDSCVSAMNETAKRRRMEIKIDVSPSVPRYFEGDEASLRRLLCRLLESAIEAATQPCIVMTVTIAEVRRPGMVRFAVGDRATHRSHAMQGARFESVWRVVVSRAAYQRCHIRDDHIGSERQLTLGPV
jgi:signal transduction histidine kinase